MTPVAARRERAASANRTLSFWFRAARRGSGSGPGLALVLLEVHGHPPRRRGSEAARSHEDTCPVPYGPATPAPLERSGCSGQLIYHSRAGAPGPRPGGRLVESPSEALVTATPSATRRLRGPKSNPVTTTVTPVSTQSAAKIRT